MSAPAIEARRTVHGGDDSALCIEVRGWRMDSDGYASTVATVAQGFGVYLHNPIAMHLRDFEPGIATREQALAAALQWADALGEHLGCKVHCWGFDRRDVLAPSAPGFGPEILEAAATLWEAALSIRENGRGPIQPGAQDDLAKALNAEWERVGTAAMRLHICAMAPDCERAWLALSEDEQEDNSPFDWEFAPKWLRERLESEL